MHGEKEEELLGSQENTVVSPSLSLSLSLSFFLFLLFSVFRVQSHGSSAHNRDSRATLKQKIYNTIDTVPPNEFTYTQTHF